MKCKMNGNKWKRENNNQQMIFCDYFVCAVHLYILCVFIFIIGDAQEDAVHCA